MTTHKQMDFAIPEIPRERTGTLLSFANLNYGRSGTAAAHFARGSQIARNLRIVRGGT
jgi:hypothetical protein